MKSYDPKKVNLIVNGITITGFADGSMISVERNEDSIVPHVGTKGEVSVAESADESGEITINLASTSPQVQYFVQLSKQKGDDADFSVSIVNMNTNGVSLSSNDCRVKKLPQIEFGDEVDEVEIVLFAGHKTVKSFSSLI